MRIIEDIRLITVFIGTFACWNAGCLVQVDNAIFHRWPVGRDPAFLIVFSSIWFAWTGGKLDFPIPNTPIADYQWLQWYWYWEQWIYYLLRGKKDRWTMMMVCYLHTKTPSIYSIPIARLVDIWCVCIYLLCIPWLWASNSWQLTIQYTIRSYLQIVFIFCLNWILPSRENSKFRISTGR
jgi:hypothetical protein